jgi:hypothetical protein
LPQCADAARRATGGNESDGGSPPISGSREAEA